MTHVLEGIVIVLIDTLVAETIDRTERVVQLYTAQPGTVFIVVASVHVVEDELVHLQNTVVVVTEVDVQVHGELAGTNQTVSGHVELPTHVAQFTVVTVGQ